MKVDLYTKAVLTVIAIALVSIVFREAIPSARAQLGSGCGDSAFSACYIQIRFPIKVTVTR